MAKITVRTNACIGDDRDTGRGIDNYADAVKWRVDDANALHIVGDNGNVGTYAPGCWLSVRFTE